MIPSSRYFSILDSATSAYSEGRDPAELQWWLPTTEQRERAILTANSLVAFRLLFGDLLRIPRNQAFDSPAWFSIAPSLLKVATPLVTVSVQTKGEPEPLSFLFEVATQFGNPNFLLSAWPGLTIDQRQQVKSNILSSRNFIQMFDRVTVGTQHHARFVEQQAILQRQYEYLLLTRSLTPGGTDRLLWDRLSDPPIQAALGEAADEFRSIPSRKMAQESLDNRGVLYKYIEQLPHDVRLNVRQHIDQQYHYTLADSVASGRIDLAHEPAAPVELEQTVRHSSAGESQYDASGLRQIYYHSLESEDSSVPESPLDWEFLVPFLNDEAFQIKLMELRLKFATANADEYRDVALAHAAALAQLIKNRAATTIESKGFGLAFHRGKGDDYIVKILVALLGPASGAAEVAVDFLDTVRKRSRSKSRSEVIFGKVRYWLTSMVDIQYPAPPQPSTS